MLQNYYQVNEELTINNFLKEPKDKKNSNYIILDTYPETFIDVRSIGLNISNLNEKLKSFKKKLSISKKDNLKSLIQSGDRVIKTQNNYYDFIDALIEILDLNPKYLEMKINEIEKKEIYALNEKDKISSARNLFLSKRINLLPVIDQLEVVGELRPIDFLVTYLYEPQSDNANYYSEKYSSSVLNMPISNLINKRPIIVKETQKLKEAVSEMVRKKLPSLIITDEKNNLYSVISYKDIFKLQTKELKEPNFNLEYSGVSQLYEDDFDLIRDYAEKTMRKITSISKYDHLKLTFKLIGDKDAGHKNRFIIKSLLSQGNKTINAQKEIITGTSDELNNDKVKTKWNIPQMVQECLEIIENKVLNEKKRNKKQSDTKDL